MARYLVAGCGYVGAEAARRLSARGHEVWGLKRRPQGLPEGVRPIAADLTDPQTLAELPGGLDGAVYAASADSFDEQSYRRAYVEGPRAFAEAVARRSPRCRLVHVSSTGVYGRTDGGWVDEDTEPGPTGFSGEVLLEGEAGVLAGPLPAVVVRLGGIYGPDRALFVDALRAGEARREEGPPRFLNLVHRDDCAGILEHLIALPSPAPLYLGVDCEPVERDRLLEWLADRLGVGSPSIAPSSGGPRRSRGNKRCSNARLLGSGYRFLHPDFRDGYAALVGAE